MILTDADFDDLVSIAWLANQQDIHILGIIVDGNGWSHLPYGADNVLKFLSLIKSTNIPVIKGSSESLEPTEKIPEYLRNGIDILWGTSLPKTDKCSIDISAEDFIIHSIENSNDKLTILALGPVTTLAKAFLKAPTIASKIENIYSTAKKLSLNGQFPSNLSLDPKASQIVADSLVPLYFVDLPAKDVPVTPFWINKIKDNAPTDTNKFIGVLLDNFYVYTKEHSLHYFFWDPLTTIGFKHQEVLTWKTDPQNPHIHVAETVDAEKFYLYLLEGFGQKKKA